MLLRNGGTHRLSVPALLALPIWHFCCWLPPRSFGFLPPNQTEQHPVAAACAVFSVSLWHQCRLLYLQRHGTYPDDLLLWSALSAGGAVSAGAPHNKTQKFLRYAAYAAMGLGIWCNVIYANQSYLKVALEEKATDALMVRVVGPSGTDGRICARRNTDCCCWPLADFSALQNNGWF